MSKRQLKIDIEVLRDAFQNNSGEAQYYLDLETGQVELIIDDMRLLSEDMDDLSEDDRYLQIPSRPSYEGYRDMEDFIQTVADTHVQELLAVAIQGKGAFRRFKDVLARYPDDLERWFKFRDERLNEYALEWLDEENIELI